MNNKDKYNKAFLDSLSIDPDDLNENMEYGSVEEWDSVGHMELIAELEDVFSITMEMDDIVDFSSYKKGIEILEKVGINIS